MQRTTHRKSRVMNREQHRAPRFATEHRTGGIGFQRIVKKSLHFSTHREKGASTSQRIAKKETPPPNASRKRSLHFSTECHVGGVGLQPSGSTGGCRRSVLGVGCCGGLCGKRFAFFFFLAFLCSAAFSDLFAGFVVGSEEKVTEG